MFAPKEAIGGEFTWPIARWDLVELPHRWLRERLAYALADPQATVEVWDPMKDAPALYREAARVRIEAPQELLAWVNQRGMLWWPEMNSSAPVLGSLLVTGRLPTDAFAPPFELGPDTERPCVRVSKVQEELETLGNAVRVLDALKGRGVMPARTVMPPEIGGLLLSAEAVRRVRQLSREPRGRRDYHLAWYALEDTVTDRLTLTATLTHFGTRNFLVRKGRHRRVLPTPSLRLLFHPTTLASCLWWQFYQAAFGGREARVCPCGEVFFPRRVDMKWHSRECYLRNYMRGYTRKPKAS
jgi:hypothetical protein